MATKVLVSACLLGRKVRYDGSGASAVGDVLERWHAEGRLVTICPEVAGGMGVPRPPAEIVGGDGQAVLDGTAGVHTADDDVSDAFIRGAEAALAMALQEDVKVAVLKARSPSCGSSQIYDGSRTRTLREGAGVTTALLRRYGIEVFSDEELDAADERLRALDQ